MSDQESVVVLFKGGRLPSWQQLSDQQRGDFEQAHVDLMLSVARQHEMSRLEGFRLIHPQFDWQRFWLLEFPSFAGAEAWVQAEMAPPYGLVGYYEYFFSRRLSPHKFSSWVTNPTPAVVPAAGDPHNVPVLRADNDSLILLMFARYRAGAEGLSAAERGDLEHETTMRAIAAREGLLRLEGFQ